LFVVIQRYTYSESPESFKQNRGITVAFEPISGKSPCAGTEAQMTRRETLKIRRKGEVESKEMKIM